MTAIVVDARFAGGPLLVEEDRSPWDPSTELVVVSGPGFVVQLFPHEARALAEALSAVLGSEEEAVVSPAGLKDLQPIENAADPRWRKLAAWLKRNPRPGAEPVDIEELLPSERATWFEIHVRGAWKGAGLSLVETDLEAHIARVAAEAPPLSPAQRDRLQGLMRSEAPGAPARELRRLPGATDHLRDLEG